MGVFLLAFLGFLVFASSVVLNANLASATNRQNGYAVAWETYHMDIICATCLELGCPQTVCDSNVDNTCNLGPFGSESGH